MAKPLKKIEARELRANGESVRKIAEKLEVSKGTVSVWVRDIVLSVDQLEKLKQRKIKGAELGRLRGSLTQKRKRLKKIEKFEKEGKKRLQKLSSDEFFVAGIALYWAEGSKKTRKLHFCNSDPNLVNFMINWLYEYFEVDKKDLAVYVGINEIHKSREKEVKKYWSEVTGIPIEQFRKTSFKKSKAKKIYKNFDKHYGTFNVTVLKPRNIYYKILGLIEGLSQSSLPG